MRIYICTYIRIYTFFMRIYRVVWNLHGGLDAGVEREVDRSKGHVAQEGGARPFVEPRHPQIPHNLRERRGLERTPIPMDHELWMRV